MSHLHVPLNARRWAAVRRAAFERDGWRCVECGKAGRLEADHIVPLKRGGDPWDPANLQSLCRGCHIEKTARENERPRTEAELRWRAMVAAMMSTGTP